MAAVALLLAGFLTFLAVGAALGLRAFLRQREVLRRLDGIELALLDLRESRGGERAEPEAPPVAADLPGLADAADAPERGPGEPERLQPPGAVGRPPAPPRPSLEQRLASRWMVWLGGATIALAVVFFVNYAIEHAWLSPLVRVMLGALLGAALIAVGNLARDAAIRGLVSVADVEPAMAENFVPAALTGAGLFALYASVEVAYAVYGLIGGPAAFVALAAVGFLGMVLALRHGWFVAALGMIGAYLAPALISAAAPPAVTLFVYLAGITWFCLWLLSSRTWPPLAAATWIAALGWALAWMDSAWRSGDELVLGPYLLAVGLLSALFPPRLGAQAALPWWPGRGVRPDDPPEGSLVGLTASGGLMLPLLIASGHSLAAVLVLAFYVLLAFLLQDHRFVDERLAAVAGALVVAMVLTWPPTSPAADGPFAGPVAGYPGLAGLLAADPRLLWSALGLTAMVWVAGVRAMPTSRDPALVAGAAAAVPLLVFLILYGRLARFETSTTWAGIAVAIALADLGAGTRAAARRAALGDAPLSAFAAAVTAAGAVAFACVLRGAWLPVALSAEVLALAWIWSRLRVAGLRVLAGIVAGAAICLLIARIGMLGEGATAARLARILYGYGLPCAMLGAATRIFAPPPAGRAGMVADSVVVGLGVLTGSLAIHHAGLGRFAELALHAGWWLLAGLALLRSGPARRPAVFAAGNLLVASGLLLLTFGNVLVQNPLVTHAPVGRYPLVNLLGPAYLLPAALLAFGAAEPGLRLVPRLRAAMAPAAGALVFLYLTLETLRLFQGSRLRFEEVGEAALYAVSSVWLAYALALLAAAFRFDLARLRPAALAVLVAAVVKVFLVDLAWLSGLTRVASFLVLGLVLVGVGEAYRRFLRPRPD